MSKKKKDSEENSVNKQLSDLYDAAKDFEEKAKAIGLRLKYEAIKLKMDPENTMPSFFKEEEEDDVKGTTTD